MPGLLNTRVPLIEDVSMIEPLTPTTVAKTASQPSLRRRSQTATISCNSFDFVEVLALARCHK